MLLTTCQSVRTNAVFPDQFSRFFASNRLDSVRYERALFHPYMFKSGKNTVQKKGGDPRPRLKGGEQFTAYLQDLPPDGPLHLPEQHSPSVVQEAPFGANKQTGESES